jgi:hypothetical protein
MPRFDEWQQGLRPLARRLMPLGRLFGHHLLRHRRQVRQYFGP